MNISVMFTFILLGSSKIFFANFRDILLSIVEVILTHRFNYVIPKSYAFLLAL